ncbi:unnamed protein product [Rangifer tarandus platyrhynchus]|uniref:Uncharacterized protein n=2 Tax=Rangifer tarandus platyrhynchus TaxID=3082113 RepID=A0AC59YJN8_RANTA|nr:unnamed protein product [Rangifer tarandus platyrhynchus]
MRDFTVVFPVSFGTGNQNGFVEVVHVRADPLRGCIPQQGQPPGRVRPGPQAPRPSLVGEKEGGSGGTCETPGPAPEPRCPGPQAALARGWGCHREQPSGPWKAPRVLLLQRPPARAFTRLGVRRGWGCRFPRAGVLPAAATPARQRAGSLASAEAEAPPPREPSRRRRLCKTVSHEAAWASCSC